MAAELTVEVVAPDQIWWSGKASMVTVMTTEGSLGFLPRHEPVLSVLTAGDIKVHTENGEISKFHVTGGFVSFHENVVRVVADNVDNSYQSATA